MFIKKIILLFFLLFLCLHSLFAQISIKNQSEYTNWYEYNKRTWENWTDVAYQKNALQLGARYEINAPPDPFVFPHDSLLQQYELTMLYADYSYKRLNFRAGNFYSMYGRGLILRTFEDRFLRVDNNILGGKMEYNSDKLNIKALTGKMRDKYNRRQDLLYGIDAEVFPIYNMLLGISHLAQKDEKNPQDQISAARFNFFGAWGDFYVEMAKPEWHNQLSTYCAFSTAFSNFTLTSEYKDYNKLAFKNAYGSEYNAPPALTREHTFTLLNRYPHALNLDDEKGYQIEVTWFPKSTWDVILNYSKTVSHSKQRIFEEYYTETHNYFLNNKFESRMAFAWNFDFTTNSENMTTIIDEQFDFSHRDLLHFSYQHQHTKNRFDKSEFDTELFLLEYSRSPYGSLALVGEYTNKFKLINVEMKRHMWLYGQMTLNFWKNQQLAILYGSRQAGFVCVGGICRYEPEFRGLEFKLINRF